MTYLELGLTADAGDLTDLAVTYLEDQRPGWQAAPGHVETWLLEAVGFIAAQVVLMSGRVPVAIFRFIGESMLRIAAITATSATGTTLWTFTDTASHTVPAGTSVAIEGVAFETTADATGTSPLSIPVIAIEPGAAGTDLSAPVDVLDNLAFVDHVTVSDTTTGGADGETDDEYVDRAASLTPTLSPKAILLEDFELLPPTVAGVDLALAIDNYVPAGPGGSPPAQTGVENAVTVALRDIDGEPVGSTATTAVSDLLTGGGNRITGTLVSIIDPTYSNVDVTFGVEVLPGWDAATVRLQGIAALQDALSPASAGVANVGERRRRWIDEPQIRRNDLIAVLYRVEGVHHVDTLTLALGGGTQATSDLTLPGPAGLPRPGVITGTAT